MNGAWWGRFWYKLQAILLLPWLQQQPFRVCLVRVKDPHACGRQRTVLPDGACMLRHAAQPSLSRTVRSAAFQHMCGIAQPASLLRLPQRPTKQEPFMLRHKTLVNRVA